MHEGDTVGAYRIGRQIGEGGMGAVFLAEHTLLGRRAAVKSLLPGLSEQREVVERFFNEARATNAITDPGVVQVFDFGYDAEGNAYLVMELLEGEPLDVRLRRLGRLPVSDALRLMRQAAGSLAATHARGIIHRDLKPENIYVVPDPEVVGGERPKILDFGIAKLTGDPGGSKTRSGVLMGTPIYMSPEQCRGAGSVDQRSDIYALGCVMFHALTGGPPFEAEGVGEILVAHMREPARAPSALRPEVPAVVDDIVLRCLAKTPEARFASMTELQQAIDAALARITSRGDLLPTVVFQSAPGLAPAPWPTTLGGASGEAHRPVAPRRRWPWLVALVMLLGAGGGGLVASLRHDGAAAAAAPADAASPPSESLDTGVPDAAVAIDAGPDAAPPDAAAPLDAAEPSSTDKTRPRPHKVRRRHPTEVHGLYDDR